MLPCLSGVGVGFNEIWLTTYLTSGGEAEETKVGGTGAGHNPLVLRSLTGVGNYLVILVPISLMIYCGMVLVGAF